MVRLSTAVLCFQATSTSQTRRPRSALLDVPAEDEHSIQAETRHDRGEHQAEMDHVLTRTWIPSFKPKLQATKPATKGYLTFESTRLTQQREGSFC